MKVFGLLLIIFVSMADSQPGFGIGSSVDDLLYTPICLIGDITVFAAAEVGIVCTSLSVQNYPLTNALYPVCTTSASVIDAISGIFTPICPYGPQDPGIFPLNCLNGTQQTKPSFGIGGFEDGILYTSVCLIGDITAFATVELRTVCSRFSQENNEAVKALNAICTLTAEILDAISGIFTPICPYGSQDTGMFLESCLDEIKDTTPGATTLSTSSPAPTTLTIETSTNPPFKSTTVSTSTPGSTTLRPCTKNEVEGCDEICREKLDQDLNFGGECITLGPSIICRCKRVERCETYTNATCKKQCKNTQICRIPEKGYPCVCRTGFKNFYQYHLPN